MIDNIDVLNNIENDKFYSPEDLAERFQVSLSSIYKLIKMGGLPHIRLGKVYRIPATDLQHYLAKQGKNISFGLRSKIPEAANFFVSELQKSPIAKNISEVWLFGSYARGDYDFDSDIDLLLVLKNKTITASKLIADLSENAMEKTNYEELLSIKEMDEAGWMTMKKNKFGLAQSIEQEGILLWKNR